MARRKDNADDWRRFNKFKEENEKLRKEVSKLRKMVQEAFIDKLEKRQNKLDNNEATIEIQHLCEQCGNDDIKTITLPRADGKFELIVCKSCGHRSELKKLKSK